MATLDTVTGNWIFDQYEVEAIQGEQPHSCFRPIERQYPTLISLNYYRPKTSLITASFYGQYKIDINPKLGSSLIHGGERYLLIEKTEEKRNWLADEVYEDIKNSENKLWVVTPSKYLEKVLLPLNQSFYQPPMFLGQAGFNHPPKVVYSELSDFKEMGAKSSENEDLGNILDELCADNKIRFVENCGYNPNNTSHVSGLKILVKICLTMLVREKFTVPLSI